MSPTAERIRLGRYEILEPLGSGGMGEVYRARDETLGREVALKVLPEAFARDDRRRARFEREARALARLSHPSILAIHDFGADAGVPYAVTELLDGETLRRRLSRSPMPWNEAVAISTSVAEGLAAAHGQGITHRDLKPENIFLLPDGRVKILDFGVARMTEPVEGTGPARDRRTPTVTITSPGTVMGTVGYMSPEQVGGRPVDGRSDIFSLGAVTYEMLSGSRPFERPTDPDTLMAILRDEPKDLAATGTAVPREVEDVVRTCLRKDPEERYQSADDLASALRSVSSGVHVMRPPRWLRLRSRLRRSWRWVALSAGVGVVAVGSMWLWDRTARPPVPTLDARTVVVAPFENRTGEPGLDPLASIAADWVSQGLIESGQLQVVPTSTAMMAAGVDLAGAGLSSGILVRQLAVRTGAGTVVSGEYYLRNEEIEFHARVTDETEGRLLHVVEPLRGPPEGAMEVITRLRESVVAAAVWRFHPGVELGFPTKPPKLDAYREYVAGLEQFHVDFPRAIEHFVRASTLDPDFVAPRMWLVSAYLNVGHRMNVPEAFEQAAAVLRGLEQEHERLSAVGRLMVRYWRASMDGRREEGLRLLREAAALAPQDAMLNFLVGHSARKLNRPQEAVDILSRIEPEYFYRFEMGKMRFDTLALAHHALGRYGEELEVGERARNHYPDDLGCLRSTVRALAAMGRVDEVDRVIDESMLLPPKRASAEDLMLVAALEYRAHGRHDASGVMAARLLRRLEARIVPDGAPEDHVNRAQALELLGRVAEAHAVWGELLDDDPEDLFLLGRFGATAALLGNPEEALRVSERLRDLDGPYRFGWPSYYRARIAAVLGDRDEAVARMRDALANGIGYRRYFHRALDFEGVRDYAPFAELMRPKG